MRIAKIAAERRVYVFILAALCTTLFLGTTLAAPPAQARSVTYNLDIPAQNLNDALQAFAIVSHHKLLYSSELVEGKRSPALKGQFTTEQAVKVLLSGTKLSYEVTSDDLVLIRAEDPPPPATAAPALAPGDPNDASSIAKEGNSSEEFRLAQANQGGTTSGSTASATQPSSDKSALTEIVVTGRYEFLSADTSGTTNLPLPIEKVPQSISLVSNDFIEAADLKTLAAIAEYTPGAINVGNQENYGTNIMLRGFTPGIAFDGINVMNPGGTGTPYEPDYAVFDRLEIVKGPSSVVYGVSSPGGLVNFVTKSATTQTPDYLSLQAGSWNSYRVEGQITGALDDSGRTRVIAVAVQDQGDSFVNDLYHKKTSVYGGININFSDSVSGYLHGGYERFERPSVDGNLTEPDGSPAPLPRYFFWGSENIVETTNTYYADTDLTWHATDMLDLSVKGNYQTAGTSGAIDYAYGLTTTGDASIAVNKFESYNIDNYGIGVSSIYRFDALGFKDSFLSIGALYQSTHTSAATLDYYGTTNIFSGQAAVSQSFDSLLTTQAIPNSQLINASTVTVSAQSVLQLIDPLTLLLGVSHSVPHETVAYNGGAPQNFNINGQMSYRAGLTYEFLPRTNAYVSYSQSFNPQTLVNVNLAPLPPLTGEQYEGGLKYRSGAGRLLLTAAAFQINEKNVAQFVEQNAFGALYAPIGEVSHKGIDLQGLGEITRQWQINAGYAYLDPKITSAITTGPNSQAATIGQTQLFLPKQSYSLFTNYTFHDGLLRGMSLGKGARYVSNQRTSYANSLANMQAGISATKDLPGYALMDGTASYTYNKWFFQLNARNIFDRRYFVNSWQTLFYGNVPGDPTNFALTVRRTF